MVDDESFYANLGGGKGDFKILGKNEVALPELELILFKYAGLIASRAAKNLNKPTQKSPSGSTASGDLEESITISPVKFMGGVYSIEVTMLDYFEIVDQGRRPNSKRPPIENIKKWIRDKQLRLNDGGTTKNGYKREGTLISKSKKKVISGKKKVSILDMTAYKIASSIGKKGIKPTYFLTNAIKSVEKNFYKELSAALKRDIRNNIVVFNPLAEKYKNK